MSLERIVEQLKQAKTLADRDIETNPNPDTIRGLRGQKARAIESVKQLTRSYYNELLTSSIFILTTGATKNEFTESAQKDERIFVASADSFYEEIVDKVSPSLYMGREGLANLIHVVSNLLEAKGNELDLNRRLFVDFRQKYQRAIKTKEDFVGIVREAINEQLGAQVVGFNAVNSILPEAIKRSNGQSRTPIILTTSDDQLTLELAAGLKELTPNVFTVAAGKTKKEFKSVTNLITLSKVTDEAVTQALELIVSKAK